MSVTYRPQASIDDAHLEPYHQLLDEVLSRVANLTTADKFVLRGGMLLRSWFRPGERRASDIDLVCNDPFDLSTITNLLLPILNGSGGDVVLDSERFRFQPIWPHTNFPGVRMMLRGTVAGARYATHIDVTFGESLIPQPVESNITLGDGRAVRMHACRPEAILARKLHVLAHLGMHSWRPKDLNDIHLILQHRRVVDDDLLDAVLYSYSSRGDRAATAADLFSPGSWWSTRVASARWHDYVSRQHAPRDLDSVVADVRGRLQPVLARLR